MSTLKVDAITDAAGTGPVELTQGFNNSAPIAFNSPISGYATKTSNVQFDIVGYNTATFNLGGGWNNSTGIFTVPTGGAGIYSFTLASVTYAESGNLTIARNLIKVNGTTDRMSGLITSANVAHFLENSTIILNLADGDTVQAAAIASTSSGTWGCDAGQNPFFCGVKLS